MTWKNQLSTASFAAVREGTGLKKVIKGEQILLEDKLVVGNTFYRAEQKRTQLTTLF